jgi:cyclase
MSDLLRRNCSELPPPSVEEVADGVFAYVQMDGSWGLNNAGILRGSRGAVLIDTSFTARRARRLADTVAQLTPLPVRTVINTHHHGDHTYGNFVFPEATVIAHERCREAVLSTGLATTNMFPEVEWGAIEIVAPFVTFSDRLSVFVDDLKVELVEMGPAAHTTNDIVAWIETERVLFSGDLVLHGATPFVLMGSVSGALHVLDRLRSFDSRLIVPGHGAVCGPETIDDQASYLRLVQETAAAAAAQGLSALEAARDCDLGRFAAWTDTERLVGNLHRALSELNGDAPGTPLPYPAIFNEMIAFNGGQPLRCCA